MRSQELESLENGPISVNNDLAESNPRGENMASIKNLPSTSHNVNLLDI